MKKLKHEAKWVNAAILAGVKYDAERGAVVLKSPRAGNILNSENGRGELTVSHRKETT